MSLTLLAALAATSCFGVGIVFLLAFCRAAALGDRSRTLHSLEVEQSEKQAV